jgi:hypothetical protein
MEVGVYGQPADSAAKWAGEGNTFAYLYESESGKVSPEWWASKMVSGGVGKFVLQDAVVTPAVANQIPRGGILGVVPGAPDPSKGGRPVYDEPERSGVSPQAFRDYSARPRPRFSRSTVG